MEYLPKMECTGIEKEVLRTLAKSSLACTLYIDIMHLQDGGLWSMVVVMANLEKQCLFKCSTNNLADTVLSSFKGAIKDNRGLWPSRIRVDRGVENVLICDEIVTHWGKGLLLLHPQIIRG